MHELHHAVSPEGKASPTEEHQCEGGAPLLALRVRYIAGQAIVRSRRLLHRSDEFFKTCKVRRVAFRKENPKLKRVVVPRSRREPASEHSRRLHLRTLMRWSRVQVADTLGASHTQFEHEHSPAAPPWFVVQRSVARSFAPVLVGRRTRFGRHGQVPRPGPKSRSALFG